MSDQKTLQDKEFVSLAKYLRGQPYKVRAVANLVKRRKLQEALAILKHLPHRGAEAIAKVLKAAASIATMENQNLDEDSLYVKNIIVDEGPRMKRMWARGRGRADLLRKRFCHIKAVLGAMEE